MDRLVRLVIYLCFLGSCVVAQPTSSTIRFGIFADTQYSNCSPLNNRFYRQSLLKLDTCIDCFNQQNVQFVISLGDIIDRKNSDLDSIKYYLSYLHSEIYHITGNHDYNEVSDNTVLYTQLDMPSSYYFFKKKNWIFIMLNTNELSVYANVKGSEREQEFTELLEHINQNEGRQASLWSGGISKKQMVWLDNLLAECEEKNNHVLICTHHPLYPQSDYTALNNMAILKTISKYTCVRAVFSGHHHAGAFSYYQGIPMITLEGMVETKNPNAYSIVDITEDSIIVKGYGRASTRSFRYSSLFN